MTDNDRNTRTLVVCFVIAFATLLPLRFLELRQTVGSDVQVLGDQTTYEEEIMLPEEDYENEYYEEESIDPEEMDVELPDAEVLE